MYAEGSGTQKPLLKICCCSHLKEGTLSESLLLKDLLRRIKFIQSAAVETERKISEKSYSYCKNCYISLYSGPAR
jgi:hypothetical protein